MSADTQLLVDTDSYIQFSSRHSCLPGGCLTLHITMHTSSDSSQPGYWLSSPAQPSTPCAVMLVMSVLCASCWQTRQAEFQYHWETRTLLSRLHIHIPCRYLVTISLDARVYFHFGSQPGIYISFLNLIIFSHNSVILTQCRRAAYRKKVKLFHVRIVITKQHGKGLFRDTSTQFIEVKHSHV